MAWLSYTAAVSGYKPAKPSPTELKTDDIEFNNNDKN
jgi:hypothetical protein